MPVKQQTGDNPGQRRGHVQGQTDEVGVVLKNCSVSVCCLHLLFLMNSVCSYTLKIHEQHLSRDENLNILTPGIAKERKPLQSCTHSAAFLNPTALEIQRETPSLFRTTDVLWTIGLTAEQANPRKGIF